MNRFIFVTMAAALCGGCALPISYTIATLMADGVSYVTTDKSLADHGISALTAQDCAIHRILTDGNVCHIVAQDEIAAVQPPPPTAAVAAAPEVRVAAVAALAPAPARKSTATPAAAAPGIYMVIGSSRDIERARAVSSLHQDMAPHVLAAPSEGRSTVYRVIVGPITESNYPAARLNASQRGLANTWAIRIKPDDRYDAGKISPSQAAEETPSRSSF